jgi:hypothetical protein
MSDTVLTAIIGVAASVVGAVATIVVARIQTAQKAAHAISGSGQKGAPIPLVTRTVDIRELRILRALLGEPKGRILEGYQSAYYAPALSAVVRKGWVKRIEGRYYMSHKGAEVCREYLHELDSWQPAAQLMA